MEIGTLYKDTQTSFEDPSIGFNVIINLEVGSHPIYFRILHMIFVIKLIGNLCFHEGKKCIFAEIRARVIKLKIYMVMFIALQLI